MLNQLKNQLNLHLKLILFLAVDISVINTCIPI